MTSETFRNQGLFLRKQFKGEGIFEIPVVKKQHVNVETVTLIGYDHIKPEKKYIKLRMKLGSTIGGVKIKDIITTVEIVHRSI